MAEKRESKLSVSDVVDLLKDGKNVLFVGAGGCGKSFALREVASLLLADEKKIAITATTGIASLNLSVSGCIATTFHRFAGIETGQGDPQELYALAQKKNSMKKWRGTEILIIDEISMFGAELFTKVEYVARTMRGNDRPFGGMTILASGDFLQLSPVKDRWIFECEVWEAMDFVPVVFTTPVRFTDKSYYDTLMRIRCVSPTEEDIQLLNARVSAYDQLMKDNNGDWSKIRPTVLYSKKIDVSTYNDNEMSKLEFPKKTFNAIDSFMVFQNEAKSEKYYSRLMDENVPETVVLKKGAQVVLKANLNTDEKLANGSRGVIIEIGVDFCDVKFVSGKTHRITSYVWEIKDKDAKFSRSQIPLRLAYSSTIHSVQGCTLDCVVMDLGPSVFSPGQAYVALSRARSIESLYISDLAVKKITASKKALRYNEYLVKNGREINIVVDKVEK